MTLKTDGLGLNLFSVIYQQRHSSRLLKLPCLVSVSYLENRDNNYQLHRAMDAWVTIRLIRFR